MRFIRIFVTVCALIGMTRSLWAQGGIGDPAVAPGSPATSYALNGIDHVNYYNGMLNTAIPVLTIGGRGEASRAITIPIQRQWGVTDAGGVYTPSSQLGSNLAGYYTSGFISTQSVTGDSWICYANGQWQASGPYITYIVWTTFDGTQTILKDVQSNGQSQGANVQDCASYNSYTFYNRGRTFRGMDGSGLTFIADQDIVDQNTPGVVSGTVITRDGLRFRVGTMDSNGRVVDGYISGIEDRNGNLINYSWQGTSTGGIYTVTDPLGRATTINYTEALNANTQDIITYPGHDGVSHTITVNYALLSTAATEPLQSYQCLFPELNGSDSMQFNSYIVSSIVLADGTSYSMQYNAYGELARLRLPTGGVYTYSYGEADCSANGGGSGVITLENNSSYRIWRPLRERDEYSDGVHLSGKLVLSYPAAPADPNHPSRATSEGMADFEDAAGNVLRKEMHFFYGNAASTQGPPTDPTAFAPWWEGLEYRSYIADGNYSVLQTMQNVYQQRPCGGE